MASSIIKLSKVSSCWDKLKLVIEILRLIRLFSTATKENTSDNNTHAMIEIEDEFFKLHTNKGREKLFKAIYKLARGIFGHDGYYSTMRDWWVERIIIKILEGKWVPRQEGWPLSK